MSRKQIGRIRKGREEIPVNKVSITTDDVELLRRAVAGVLMDTVEFSWLHIMDIGELEREFDTRLNIACLAETTHSADVWVSRKMIVIFYNGKNLFEVNNV